MISVFSISFISRSRLENEEMLVKGASEKMMKMKKTKDEDEDTNWVRNRGSKFFEAEINKFPLAEKKIFIYMKITALL